MSNIKTIIKSDFVISIFASGIHAALMFIYGVYVRRFITPEDYGVYTAVYLVLTYFNYLQLGVINAYNRDYPQAVGANDVVRMNNLKVSTIKYTVAIYSLAFVVLGAIVGCLFSSNNIDIKHLYGYISMGGISLVTNVSTVLSISMKSEGNFKRVSLAVIISNIIHVVVGAISVYKLNYYGMFIPLLLTPLIQIAFTHKTFKVENNAMSIKVIKRLILTGVPLMVNGFVWTLIHTTDQFIILTFSDNTNLGMYSVAQTMFSAMLLIPQTISQVLYIKMSNKYGENENEYYLVEKTKEYSSMMVIITSMFCVIANYLLPTVVKVFMPQYVDGINAAKTLSWGLAIYSAAMLCGNIFSILKLNKQLILSSIILCISNIIFSSAIVLCRGFDIVFVAIGSALSYLLYSVILLLRIVYRYKLKIVIWLRDLYLPLTLILFPNVISSFIIKSSVNLIVFALIYNSAIAAFFVIFKLSRISKWFKRSI